MDRSNEYAVLLSVGRSQPDRNRSLGFSVRDKLPASFVL
jgi:hypothetical protein